MTSPHPTETPSADAVGTAVAELAGSLDAAGADGWAPPCAYVGSSVSAPAPPGAPEGGPDRLSRHSARDEVEKALRTVEQIQDLNAFLSVRGEQALVDADAIDQALMGDVDVGPLAGVPVAVKDVIDVAGLPTTGGSDVLASHVSTTDAPLVAALRESGAIIVGKTNMNELGWGLCERIGPVVNPHDPQRTAGGSSGGSAAAVAAGAVRLAIGTDSGGSVRMPASFCGIVGYKPSPGMLLSASGLSTGWSLGVPGLLARSVDDVRVAVRAVGRESGRVPATVPAHPRLVVADGATEGLDETVERAFADAVGRLEAAMGTLACRPVDGIEDWRAAWVVTYTSEFVAATASWLGDPTGLSADVRHALEVGRRLTATSYLRAQQLRGRLQAGIDEALGDADALLTPTVDHVAPEAELDPDDSRYFSGMRWLAPCNLSGHPAITLPLRGEGLPVGLQLVGRRGGDDALLAVSERVEELLAL